jgi:hypothetical protein
MIERRETPRDKVIYGGIASIGDRGATRDCVVRNISDKGASIEFGSAAGLPKDLTLTISRKGRSFLARVIWWSANTIGVAFRDVPDASDLDERLRKSEKKKRELQRRIKILLGEG